ncbi:hypothetical protein, partial [Acinetobacter baumannii]|uniref:hypothetical protein n=1 Tax=Acinetobacter baumannii TaxID=470 RepID=UPI0016801A45
HLGSETDQVLWVLIAQIFILCISYFLKPHWFFILIQMLATYGIAVIYLSSFMGIDCPDLYFMY